MAPINFYSLQYEPELIAFIELMKREGVISYLEVGANYGGTFRKIGMALDSPSRLVAVDIGGETPERFEAQLSLKQAAADLNAFGRLAKAIFGDSTDPATVARVREHGPFDCVFIDGNHKESFVRKDWENYGAMGRIVAFHDIAWRRLPEWKEGQRIDVPKVWESLKAKYRHEEIRLVPNGKNCGIGVLWRS